MFNKLVGFSVLGVTLALVSSSTLASKTKVCIQTSNEFKKDTITFSALNANTQALEGVGLHRANGINITCQEIGSIVDKEGTHYPLSNVFAYVGSDNPTHAGRYVSMNGFHFLPDHVVNLSFPLMFEKTK